MQEEVPKRFRPFVSDSDRSYIGNRDQEVVLPDEEMEWLRDMVQEIAARIATLNERLKEKQALLEDVAGMANIDREEVKGDVDDMKTSLFLFEKLHPLIHAELAEWERQADADKTHFEKETLEARTRRYN